jgi:SAM-dependent methyltransferase
MRKSGIPTKEEFFDNFENKEVEEFSNSFLQENKDKLKQYSQKWVSDPYSTWSRRWEYSYALERIRKSKEKVMDAGSGLTFLPAILKSRGHDVTCLDSDRQTIESAKEVGYNAICGNLQDDIQDKFDTIICISVLEHLDDKEAVLKNFSNLLNDGGQLILTYDICLDGDRDIPYDKVGGLDSTINKFFSKEEDYEISVDNAITTDYFIQMGFAHLLPWKTPVKANFTFFCGSYKKEDQ